MRNSPQHSPKLTAGYLSGTGSQTEIPVGLPPEGEVLVSRAPTSRPLATAVSHYSQAQASLVCFSSLPRSHLSHVAFLHHFVCWHWSSSLRVLRSPVILALNAAIVVMPWRPRSRGLHMPSFYKLQD